MIKAKYGEKTLLFIYPIETDECFPTNDKSHNAT